MEGLSGHMFVELPMQKQLEVSEQDAKAILEEHFLDPPGEQGCTPRLSAAD